MSAIKLCCKLSVWFLLEVEKLLKAWLIMRYVAQMVQE